MNIIIPLGGTGERFTNEGYTFPKPFIKVMGHEIIFWLIDSLNHSLIKTIYISYHYSLYDFRFEEIVANNYPKLSFVFIKPDIPTKGAAEAIFQVASQYISDAGNIMCLDVDTFYNTDIIKLYQQSTNKNTVFCFKDYSENPIYSYTQLDDNLHALNIAEKIKISNYANVGIYCFENANTLKKYCEYIIKNKIMQKGQYYISGVYKQMIQESTVNAIVLNNGDYVCLGTPLQVKLFCNNFSQINTVLGKVQLKQKRVCFDLDNTLVTFPKVYGDYTTVEPIEKNIRMAQYIKKLGNTIIIHTARRMKTHNGNVGKLLLDIGKITFDTIEKYNIPCDEIYFGKPDADFYIDDKAILPYNNLQKDLGYYKSIIDPRSFNALHEKSIQIYRKESTDLDGQINWYLSIPTCIKDMFPTLISYDNENYKWYDMEKLDAISVSKLYLSGTLTKDILHNIINSINKIHNCIVPTEEINIYANYSQKITNRYNYYNYSQFENSENVYNTLIKYFDNYEKNKCGVQKVIHGDTVLTNIMINVSGKIKFIDMRGLVGNKVTIYGDIFYDWAKLYQSLIGYDEILDSCNINLDYKKTIIDEFEHYIVTTFGSDNMINIKYITASLLFTLLPLHDNTKCQEYYNLCSKIISELV